MTSFKRFRTSLNLKSGITLVELLIVMGVTSVFLVGVTYIFLTIWQAWGYQVDREESGQEAFLASEKMTKELRGLLNVTSADSLFIEFYCDLNDNGIPEADELITYSWSGVSGASLIKSWGKNTSILAHNVESFNFAYFNVNNLGLITPVGTPSTIRRISFNLKTKIKDETISLRTEARPRNL
ncbi:MAG: hypothetical protein V1674_01520 [Candidatus Omnitrophota bacterium]